MFQQGLHQNKYKLGIKMHNRSLSQKSRFRRRSPLTKNQMDHLALGQSVAIEEQSAPRKFFDISYFFEKPFTSHQNSTYSGGKRYHSYTTCKTPKKRVGSASEAKQINERLTQPRSQSSKINKLNIFFDNYHHEQSIHSGGANRTFHKTITHREHKKSLDLSTLDQDLIVTKRYNSIVNSQLETSHPEKEEKKSICAKKWKRVEVFNPEAEENRQTWLKKKRRIQKLQMDKYWERGVQYIKNALVLKNKSTIRIYRPWSPVHLDCSSDFQSFNVGF